MGNRAMVKIQCGASPGVYLYTHQGGAELEQDVRCALARQARWDDASYLARIVFEAMIGNQQGRETGLGIQAISQDDLQHPLIVLDTQSQCAWLCPIKGSGEPDEAAGFGRMSMDRAALGDLAPMYHAGARSS